MLRARNGAGNRIAPEEASSLFPSPRAECWPGVRVSPFSPLCGSWCRAPHAASGYRPRAGVLLLSLSICTLCRPRRFLYNFCHCGSMGYSREILFA